MNRQRLLQIGFVVAAAAAVVVADATAGRLLMVDASLDGRRMHAFLLVGGRVVAGWALGMAFRMQFTRSTATDAQLRALLGVPAGFLAAWPIVMTFLPGWLVSALPTWLRSGWALDLSPFAGLVLGLTLALAVTARRA